MPVIVSDSASLPTDLALFRPQRRTTRALVFVGPSAAPAAKQVLEEHGDELTEVAEVGGRLWIPAILETLVERGMTRLLV